VRRALRRRQLLLRGGKLAGKRHHVMAVRQLARWHDRLDQRPLFGLRLLRAAHCLGALCSLQLLLRAMGSSACLPGLQLCSDAAQPALQLRLCCNTLLHSGSKRPEA
jgi:hypothetical protein